MSEPDEPEITRSTQPALQAPPPRRWSKRRRVALWTGAALALLLVLAAALLLWALSTSAGARFVFSRVSALVPGKLEARSIEGPIRGPLVLRDLHYQTERFDVTIAEDRKSVV